MAEITAAEQIKGKKEKKRNKDNLKGLWTTFQTHQHSYYRHLRRRETGPKKIYKGIIAKNFPNMGKEIVIQVQEVQRVPGRINLTRNTSKHRVIKLTKVKDKDIKSNRGKATNNIKGNSHNVIS